MKNVEQITGLQKAAVLMIMLGDDVASIIYRNLPERDVQEITREIASMDYVTPDLGVKVMEE